MKCVLHFSNGVFNSLAPVKRGDNVYQLRKTEWMGESEEGEGKRPTELFACSCQEKKSSILKGVFMFGLKKKTFVGN